MNAKTILITAACLATLSYFPSATANPCVGSGEVHAFDYSASTPPECVNTICIGNGQVRVGDTTITTPSQCTGA